MLALTYHHFRMLGWNFPQHTFIRYGALNLFEQLSRSAARVRSFSSRHYGDHQNPILKGVARVASASVLPIKLQRGGAIFHPRRIAVTKPEARLHSAPLQSASDKRGDSRLSPNAEFGEMSHTRLCCGGRIQARGCGQAAHGRHTVFSTFIPCQAGRTCP